ncbi:hypothetical protein BSL78_06429 [Apostichopus japonicus]|uniref:Reverse transcriptase domain-containing protein n=1 Tax=Stichopus japonicus TaxID=307972 RepID=A0A2G8L8P8_STIJA|nr:hypothetical protein BSL78_06429 [Apostichopus japonicus]
MRWDTTPVNVMVKLADVEIEAVIDTGSQMLNLGILQSLSITITHQSPIKAKVVQGVVKVAGKGKVRIPARSAIVLPVTGPVCSEVAEVIVEPVENLPAGVSVCCTLTFACKGHLNLQVVNLSEEEMWLNPRSSRTPLGKLQCATMVDDGSVNFEGMNRLNAAINFIQMDGEPDAESVKITLEWSLQWFITAVCGYRRLNEKTIKDSYPIPRIDESLDALHGAEWFSSIDLLVGYHQAAVDKADRCKTSFTTPFGLFEYNRMPIWVMQCTRNFPTPYASLLE